MKIYFENGKLLSSHQLPFKPSIKIDAGKGLNDNIKDIEFTKEALKEPCIVYTNQPLLLDNKYAWNEKEQISEIYIRAGEHCIFHRIDTLTEREIRFSHNILKMYINNAFETNYSGDNPKI